MTTSVGITVDELRERLDRREPVTILDVRPSAEREEWSIPGSVHVDAYERLWAGDAHALDRFVVEDGAPVVTVCAAGRTSLLAALQLRQRGIDARSLSGGMKAWSLAWNSVAIRLPASSAEVVQVRRTGKGCLSYLIGAGDQAAVVDAALAPAVYQELAARHGWTITHVVDTHVHADHLTRARQLAEATGATLNLPAQDRVSFPYAPLRDGDVLQVGGATIEVLHTPGHTLESTSYLVDGEALCTGDTLFLNGVGRPDLEASPAQARERAHLLYASLQRLMALPAATLVLPGHTSVPVGFDDTAIVATLGAVREQVALLQADEEAFVTALLGRIPPTPPNHHLIVQLNEAGLVPEPPDAVELEAGANRCAVS